MTKILLIRPSSKRKIKIKSEQHKVQIKTKFESILSTNQNKKQSKVMNRVVGV